MSTEEILIAKVNRMDGSIKELTKIVTRMASLLMPGRPEKKPEQWVSRREWMTLNNKTGEQWRYMVDTYKGDKQIVKETKPSSGRYLVNILANI